MPKSTPLKKWNRFEHLVEKIQREMAPDATVTIDDKIVGRITQKKRQIDISIKQKVGQYEVLIAIDCKDLKKPADVKDVEAVIGLFKDVGANKGVIVSANGFTATALKRGTEAGITLYRLLDTDHHDWKAEVKVPILCEFLSIERYSLSFDRFVPLVARSGDLRYIEIYDEANQLIGEIDDILKRKWNNKELPRETGEHTDMDFLGGTTRIRNNNVFFDVKIAVSLRVKSEIYFGEVSFEEFSGFKDEISGRFLAQKYKGDLNFSVIKKEWLRIESRDELAVEPLFSFYRVIPVYDTVSPHNPPPLMI